MSISILGFPRIGEHRELKFALESYWAKESSLKELESLAQTLRKKHWEVQKDLDYVCVNDFSYYDNMLDLAYALGIKPQRFQNLEGLELYFAMARGHKNGVACAMTKWFNTNYHFVVPELDKNNKYILNTDFIIKQYKEAVQLGYTPKIALIGFFTFFALSHITNGDAKEIFKQVQTAYLELIDALVGTLGNGILIEFSEPIFAKGLEAESLYSNTETIQDFYNTIVKKGVKTIVSTFFEQSCELTEILVKTDIYGIGLDFVYGNKNLASLDTLAKSGKVLFAGIIDGRNIWIANLEEKLTLIQNITKKIPQNKLTLTTSCSLLHTPYSKNTESKMDSEILSWLSFSVEKIEELKLLNNVLKDGIQNHKTQWERYIALNQVRKNSLKIHNQEVQARANATQEAKRTPSFKDRIKIQQQHFNLPLLPTTTIGSFPQTKELRNTRKEYKSGKIAEEAYTEHIQNYIKDCVRFQEEIGLDVLVHGEPERNDMVEYFGEQLSGFVFSQNGWVQSYGSRCVKPPIIFGDVARLQPMTIQWSVYAQSLTQKIMKGMLTGPVTILNWSFVRDDIPRSSVCKQIALGIADEINDLQNAGIRIIQVDEAAFKEGYPLRKENIKEYEQWALYCFRLATSLALPQTQIHTHMCYSAFNDIIKTIEAMDADVITIETARNGNKLLHIFQQVGYDKQIGPGVYDIHSPRIPSVAEIKEQIQAILEVLPKEQVWINPDCGLKTRKYEEVKPSLKNMVEATKEILKDL
ncbi:5-methyltetrahydropteroyltriglutamate--homocysteine S-methyltransferase [Helicobacter sp.]|uniref:5-methyltetrahydropteroyltriglutamate-- homocysteine S-methyltransferase n=1 Tax=Helicobacter sp. TaxID=218 RepID=UPI0025C06396|nr:5-methyltetrahydropteroyltriglutamate--homocysteine S-methyltransferase [Helicobacter sp.]MCI5969454.1 5-methyltetrahydropteroyltriglutamate--homocysteine S-methyltransferase [Helicobacter sp.]MDY2584225.1 5-methyltetrahydropteroyltriglutamate--homocysteine S-methyltransferase [Helicobacter sp.]